MNMDDIDSIINYLMAGEDLDDDDDVKVRVYTTSNKIKKTNPYMSSEDIIKNRTNKPNKKFSNVYQSNDKILKGTHKDFHPFGDLKVEKAIYRPEAQKANHEVNNQLNGSYKELATVKDGVNAVRQILDQAMIVLNDLEEKLKNV